MFIIGFRYDTKHLSGQQQAIIRQRDKNNELTKKESERKPEVMKNAVYNKAIFMRLGYSVGYQFNGIDTLKIYENFCNKNMSVWFSTNSLAYGMAKGKRTEFIKAINDGYIVEIYFAVGKNGGGSNEIEYKGEVTDIKSDADGIKSPDVSLTPVEWQELKNKIWIKIKRLTPCKNFKTSDFLVISSGNVLAKSIENSEYHFGYIKRKC